MTDERISSEGNLRERLRTVGSQLDTLDGLVADLKTARSRLEQLEKDAAKRLEEVGRSIEGAKNDLTLVRTAVAEGNAALKGLEENRAALRGELEATERAIQGVPDEVAKVGARLSETIAGQFRGLDSELRRALAEGQTALQGLLDEHRAQVRTLLTDAELAQRLLSNRLTQSEQAHDNETQQLRKSLGEAVAANSAHLARRLQVAFGLTVIALFSTGILAIALFVLKLR